MFLFFVLLFFVFVLPSSVIKNDFKTKYRTFCSERRDDKRSVIDRLTHQPMSNKNIIAEKNDCVIIRVYTTFSRGQHV